MISICGNTHIYVGVYSIITWKWPHSSMIFTQLRHVEVELNVLLSTMLSISLTSYDPQGRYVYKFNACSLLSPYMQCMYAMCKVMGPCPLWQCKHDSSQSDEMCSEDTTKITVTSIRNMDKYPVIAKQKLSFLQMSLYPRWVFPRSYFLFKSS